MLLIAAGRVAQFILALISVRVLTTLLPPEEIGKISLITTGTAFFALFFVNPVGMFINRRLHDWIALGRFKTYFRHYVVFLLAVSCAAVAIATILIHLLDYSTRFDWRWVALLVAGSLVFNTIAQTLIPSLNILGHNGPFMALTLGTLLSSLLLATAIAAGYPKAEAWLLGILLGQVLFSFVAYRFFFRRVPERLQDVKIAPEQVRKLLSFAVPVAVAVGLNWLHLQGYRFVLGDAVGLHELGLFMAGYGVAAALLAGAETILATWFQPRFYREANLETSGDRSELGTRSVAWANYANAILPLSILAAGGVAAAAPSLVAMMLGPKFGTAGIFVAFGALAEGVRIVLGVAGLHAHARMTTARLIVPGAVGASISSLFIWAFLPDHGVLAAPVGVAIGGAAATLAFLGNASFRQSVRKLRPGFFVLAIAAAAAILLTAPWVRQFTGASGMLGHLINLAILGLLAAGPGAWLLQLVLRQHAETGVAAK
jgi:O-antigen/teichoic acid export membrane protein